MKTLLHGIIIASVMISAFFYGMYEGYKMGREDEREIKKQVVVRTSKKLPYRVISEKPYLFSLTDLTKEIEFGGQRFVPIHRLKSNPNWYVISDCDKVEKYVFEILELISTGGWTGQLPNWIVDQLRAWMFNVDGLEEDQYIRVTEENSPYR